MIIQVRKRTIRYVPTEKIQIRLRESSLGAFWISKERSFFMWTMKTDQTARMRRLIWVFVVRMSSGTFSYVAVHLNKWMRYGNNVNLHLMSRGTVFPTLIFPTRVHANPAKTHTFTCPSMRTFLSESSLNNLRVENDPKCHQADAQADLSFRWDCRKCCVPAYFWTFKKKKKKKNIRPLR